VGPRSSADCVHGSVGGNDCADAAVDFADGFGDGLLSEVGVSRLQVFGVLSYSPLQVADLSSPKWAWSGLRITVILDSLNM